MGEYVDGLPRWRCRAGISSDFRLAAILHPFRGRNDGIGIHARLFSICPQLGNGSPGFTILIW